MEIYHGPAIHSNLRDDRAELKATLSHAKFVCRVISVTLTLSATASSALYSLIPLAIFASNPAIARLPPLGHYLPMPAFVALRCLQIAKFVRKLAEGQSPFSLEQTRRLRNIGVLLLCKIALDILPLLFLGSMSAGGINIPAPRASIDMDDAFFYD